MAGRVTGVLAALGYKSFPVEHRKQISALDREFHEMGLEITRLNAEIQKLEAQVQPKQREIERLQEIIEADSGEKERAAKAAARKEDHLTDDEVKALKVCAYCEMKQRRGAELAAIAAYLKANEISAQVIMRGLSKRRYVRYDQRVGEGWKLDDRGQEYLVKYDLLRTSKSRSPKSGKR
jgi:TolA-binding protein